MGSAFLFSWAAQYESLVPSLLPHSISHDPPSKIRFPPFHSSGLLSLLGNSQGNWLCIESKCEEEDKKDTNKSNRKQERGPRKEKQSPSSRSLFCTRVVFSSLPPVNEKKKKFLLITFSMCHTRNFRDVSTQGRNYLQNAFKSVTYCSSSALKS